VGIDPLGCGGLIRCGYRFCIFEYELFFPRLLFSVGGEAIGGVRQSSLWMFLDNTLGVVFFFRRFFN